MDEFFQKLREIQKKERSVSGLAHVGDNFYNEVYTYFHKLMKEIGDNPLSFYSYIHRDARRIVAEIFERREHKIINSALLNIQRSHELFGESSSKNESESPTLPPQNMTPEEENLYYAITKTFSNHRKKTFHSINGLEIENKSKSSSKEQKSSIKPKGKAKEDFILGIEHDIESYEVIEAPDFMEPENVVDVSKTNDLDQLKLKKNEIRTILVLDDMPSIIGVDREIYGPLITQDIVNMPEANAQIIINNKKGKLIKKNEEINYK